MRHITPGAVLLGLLMSGPALVNAFQSPTGDLVDAMVAFLLAVLVAAAGLAALEALTDAYRHGAGRVERRTPTVLRATAVREDLEQPRN